MSNIASLSICRHYKGIVVVVVVVVVVAVVIAIAVL